MAAASYSSDVLESFYGPISRENLRLPEPSNGVVDPVLDEFELNQNNFGEWLREWRMNVSQEKNPNRGDLNMFEIGNRTKIIDLIKQEIQKLKSVRVSFQMQVKFSREETVQWKK